MMQNGADHDSKIGRSIFCKVTRNSSNVLHNGYWCMKLKMCLHLFGNVNQKVMFIAIHRLNDLSYPSILDYT